MIKLLDIIREVLKEEISKNDKDVLKTQISSISKEITNYIFDNNKENKVNFTYTLNFSTPIPIKIFIKNINSKEEYSVTGQALPKNKQISIHIKYNSSLISLISRTEIQNEIYITIWHELKHIFQYIQRNQAKPKYQTQLRNIDYYLDQDEIEAYAEELYIQHELTQTPLEDVLKKFEDNLNKWLEDSIQQRIKGGFSPEKAQQIEGTPEDIKNIINQIRNYLDKEYLKEENTPNQAKLFLMDQSILN